MAVHFFPASKYPLYMRVFFFFFFLPRFTRRAAKDGVVSESHFSCDSTYIYSSSEYSAEVMCFLLMHVEINTSIYIHTCVFVYVYYNISPKPGRIKTVTTDWEVRKKLTSATRFYSNVMYSFPVDIVLRLQKVKRNS